MSIALNKRRTIVDAVRSRIRSAAFRSRDRIPSDSELEREFGVSRPTIAKAPQELEESGLVKRKAGSGTYVLNSDDDIGRHFGLLIPRLGSTEFFEPICAQMATTAQDGGHSLLWGASGARAIATVEADRAMELSSTKFRAEWAGCSSLRWSTCLDSRNQHANSGYIQVRRRSHGPAGSRLPSLSGSQQLRFGWD